MHSSSPPSSYMPCPCYPPWRDLIIILGQDYKLWTSSLWSFLQPPVTSSLFGPIFFSAPFPNTLSLCLYKHSVRTSQETHYVSATETNRLMLFKETVAVYCENHTDCVGTMQSFGMLQHVVHTEPFCWTSNVWRDAGKVSGLRIARTSLYKDNFILLPWTWR
jgi:hypothetical protein